MRRTKMAFIDAEPNDQVIKYFDLSKSLNCLFFML